MVNEMAGSSLLNAIFGGDHHKGGKYVPSTIFPTPENPAAGLHSRFERPASGEPMEQSIGGYRHTHELVRVGTLDSKSKYALRAKR